MFSLFSDESVPLVADKEQITLKEAPPIVMDSPLNPLPVRSF